MGVDRTMNPRGENAGSGKRKCWGCNLRDISQMCSYRWWPDERRPAYRFRIFRKIHLLPTCRRENFEYPEREAFVKKYCDTLGIDYTEIVNQGGGRGGGKRGGRVKRKPMMI
jgi:hypothetical protein